MKIIAVIPNPLWINQSKDINYTQSIFMINGLIGKKHKFELIDANADELTRDELFEKLTKSKPDVLMVSGLSIRDRKIYDITFTLAKESYPNCVTIFGGIYPTILPEEAFSNNNIDIIFLGHIEKRLLPLLDEVDKGNINKLGEIKGIGFRDVDGNILINNEFESIKELEFNYDPSYEGIDLEKYFTNESERKVSMSPRIADRVGGIMAVFGCPYNCSFCANQALSGGGYKYRSIESIMQEIAYQIEKYKINSLGLGIDCICADRLKFIEIISSMHKRWPKLKWNINPCIWHLDNELMDFIKEQGCASIVLSVECGHQENLKKLVNKPLKLDMVRRVAAKLKALRIFTSYNFLIGFPGETWQEIRESLAFADSLDGDYVQINIATPLPKTKLYARAKEAGYLSEEYNHLNCLDNGHRKGLINTPEFTSGELEILRTYEWDRINFKTEEKINKICNFLNITRKKLDENRKNARLNIIKQFKK